MLFLISKTDDFILNGRAIPWANPFNITRIHRGFVQIFFNDFSGFTRCKSDKTGQLSVYSIQNRTWWILPLRTANVTWGDAGLFHVEQILLPEAEVRNGFISGLFLCFFKIDGSL